jgi:hypothetical protein
MRFGIFATRIVVLPLMFAGGAAFADDSGLAQALHEVRKVGGKLCLTDHYHDGSGSGANQELALRQAIRSWQSFTDLEYGSDWASYNNSVGKSVSCGRSMGEISCTISSRPCKGGVLEKVQPATYKRKATKKS